MGWWMEPGPSLTQFLSTATTMATASPPSPSFSCYQSFEPFEVEVTAEIEIKKGSPFCSWNCWSWTWEEATCGRVSTSSSSPSFSPSFGSSPSYQHYHYGSGSSSSSSSPSSSRNFFDEESFDEFQSIGLGKQELEMLRQLPENLQYEYKQEMEELETAASEPREADIMEYLSATNEFDTDHCIAEGICEVMSRGNRTSNEFENLLLEYYNEERETRKDPAETPAYIYDYAAFLGKSRRDDRACASYFPKCPEPTHQLTGFMNEVFASEMCDPPVRNEL